MLGLAHSLFGHFWQPNGQFSVVDVRDVAMAHVLCIEKPEANGKRFILDGDGYHSDASNGTQRSRDLFLHGSGSRRERERENSDYLLEM